MKILPAFLQKREQLLDRELLEDGVVHRADVAADQPGVGLADLRDRLAGGVVDDGDLVDRLVGLAVTEDGDVEHGVICSVLRRFGNQISAERNVQVGERRQAVRRRFASHVPDVSYCPSTQLVMLRPSAPAGRRSSKTSRRLSAYCLNLSIAVDARCSSD